MALSLLGLPLIFGWARELTRHQGGVGYVLYTDVFSPNSKTVYFNLATDRIKKDPRCLELLGDAKKIMAHGEETMNKWRRSRPLAYVDLVHHCGRPPD